MSDIWFLFKMEIEMRRSHLQPHVTQLNFSFSKNRTSISLTSIKFDKIVALFLWYLIILTENSNFLLENETDQSLFFKQQVSYNHNKDIVLALVCLIPYWKNICTDSLSKIFSNTRKTKHRLNHSWG